jgi:hypothetical protein
MNLIGGYRAMNSQEPPVQQPETTPRPPAWQGQLSQRLRQLPGQGRKHWQWLVIGVLLVCILAVFLVGRRPGPLAQGPHRVAPDTMSFPIDSQPDLIFAHSIGEVHLTSGADGRVLIKEMKNGFPDAIQIHYQQKGDTITTTSDIQSGLMEDTWVDFVVSIPRQSGMVVTLKNGGTLEATGLNGTIALSNTNGSIWATNLNGTIALKTESGSINAKHVTGQMMLATQNGTITTSDVHLRGHSTVRAESGTINFHGSLDPKGHSLFVNGNGAVGLTLSQSGGFHVDAQTSSGALNLNYPGITVQHQSHGVSRNEAHGNVGKPPLAELTIQTTSGPITLSREG